MSLLLTAFLASSALAQDAPEKFTRLVICEDIILYGQVPKPQIQVFIGRERLADRETTVTEASHVDRIVAAVDTKPF